MILNLKEVFLQEGSKKAFEYSFSMSDIDISGVYPFVSPIMVKGEALNRAGLVDVNFDVSFTYNRPCDRCFKDVSRELNYQFNHRLVVVCFLEYLSLSLHGSSEEEPPPPVPT